jgi:enoyl-CoA hydratase/carnithine racemase
MGACAILPRIIGHGRASELLYTGRVMTARKPIAGDFSTASLAETVVADAHALAKELPTARPSPMP